MRFYNAFILIGLSLLGCESSNDVTPKMDNSEINERDQGSNAKTPLDQNENQKDIDITAKIRRQVVDTELSVNAQNVKIMTQDGKVTLRGPVATIDEKNQIEMIARKVAGDANVDNQIDVSNSN